MNHCEQYSQIINDVFSAANSAILSTSEAPELIKEKDQLLEILKTQSVLKLPVVGGFNAGKSTLLNTILGRDLLPTNITPETAVAYELYYSEEEKLETVEHGKVTNTLPLGDINKITYKPSLYVRVFLNNDTIRRFNEKGIVVVDMPGLDSGVEKHNNAIMEYIQDGTVFALIVDCEAGTLTSSAITFLKEIRTYGLKVEVFLSKIEKKKENISEIQEFITKQAQKYISVDTQVHLLSALQGNVGEFISFVDSVDSQEYLRKRFKGQVEGLLMKVITNLQLQITLKNTPSTKYQDLIEKIKEEKASALDQLKHQMASTQPLEGSVEDIMDDVRHALLNNASLLANIAFKTHGNGNELKNQLLAIIRPALINGVRRELTEYADCLSPVVENFMVNINEIISQNATPENIIEDFDPLKGMVESWLLQLITRLIARIPLLKFLSILIGPIVEMLFKLLNNLVDILTGSKARREQKMLIEIQQKFEGEIADQIIAHLRPEITRLIREERQ